MIEGVIVTDTEAGLQPGNPTPVGEVQRQVDKTPEVKQSEIPVIRRTDSVAALEDHGLAAVIKPGFHHRIPPFPDKAAMGDMPALPQGIAQQGICSVEQVL